MTSEQESFINAIVASQVSLLIEVKKKYHNSEWTPEFGELVSATKEKLIWDIENSLLNPVNTIAPTTRTFPPEEEDARHEIRRAVYALIQHFKEYPNG